MIFGMARRCGAVAALAASATLVACGGGGGGGSDGGTPTFSAAPSGPPTTAASPGTTSADAIEAAKAAVATADGAATRQNALAGFVALAGPVASGGPGLAFGAAMQPAGTKQALAVSTDPCTEFVSAPCTGTVTTDTNIPSTATTIARGQYLDGTFNAISGSLNGSAVTLSGRLRVEFLTALNPASSSLAGVQMRLVFAGFGGSVAGLAFGPLSETVDLLFDNFGAPTLVTQGASFGTLAGVTSTGTGSYTIANVSARVGFGSAASTYVDVALSDWRASGGRPAAGFARVNAPGWATTVTVVAASGNGVIYDVSIAGNVPGSGGQYRITATYPTGGGAPTYAVVAG